MNLTTFRLRIQSTTGLAASTAGHNEQALVDGWVNEGVEQFLLRTKIVKKTAVLDLTAGEGDYVLDPGILSLKDLYIGARMLEAVDTSDVRRWRLTQGGVSDGVTRYAYEGQVLFLYPTPSAAGQLHIILVKRPTPMTSGTHDPGVAPYGEVPPEYHTVIEAYGKWKAAEYANDQPSQNGQAYKAEYEAGLVQARVLETRKAGVSVRRARPGWKASGVGIAPGLDQGV